MCNFSGKYGMDIKFSPNLGMNFLKSLLTYRSFFNNAGTKNDCSGFGRATIEAASPQDTLSPNPFGIKVDED